MKKIRQACSMWKREFREKKRRKRKKEIRK